jgi:NAD(P)-dependent dehydrogenase (short-subunit alcohol dehydrogenase family)
MSVFLSASGSGYRTCRMMSRTARSIGISVGHDRQHVVSRADAAADRSVPLRYRGAGRARHRIKQGNRARTGQRAAGREVADLVGPLLFLAGPASDFVNGQVLYVDGGMLSVL